jgi:hypothetical protein
VYGYFFRKLKETSPRRTVYDQERHFSLTQQIAILGGLVIFIPGQPEAHVS